MNLSNQIMNSIVLLHKKVAFDIYQKSNSKIDLLNILAAKACFIKYTYS